MGIIIEEGSVPTEAEGVGYEQNFEQPFTNLYPQQTNLSDSAIPAGTTDYMSAFYGGMGVVTGVQAPNSGVAAGLLGTGGLTDPPKESSWIKEGLKWFGEQQDQTKAATVTIAGSFLAGLLRAPMEERKTKAAEKTADANMMMAEAQNKKFENASGIGKTTFGQVQPTPVFDNKLIERQKRAGYKGVA